MSEVLRVQSVSKSFPGVQALKDVSLSLRGGEVQALLGENGAGKSTLIKILTGVYQADEGHVLIDGEPVTFDSPLEAARAGIGVVHQERNLIPYFTVAENIVLQEQPNRFGVIDAGPTGWNEIQFRELDGKVGQELLIFGDDFTVLSTGVEPGANGTVIRLR